MKFTLDRLTLCWCWYKSVYSHTHTQTYLHLPVCARYTHTERETCKNTSSKETVNIMVDYIRCGSNVRNYVESTRLCALDTCSFETVFGDDGGNKSDAITTTTTTPLSTAIVAVAAAATKIIVIGRATQSTFCVFAHDPTEHNIFFRTIYNVHQYDTHTHYTLHTAKCYTLNDNSAGNPDNTQNESVPDWKAFDLVLILI